MSLPSLGAENRTMPLSQLAFWTRSGEIHADLSYQRGLVWGQERKRALIQSLLIGLPIGAIFLNENELSDGYRVVDGKQRIAAVTDFLTDGFSVPTHWFDSEGVPTRSVEVRVSPAALDQDEVHFSDLTVAGQRFMQNRSTGVYITSLPTEEQEIQLFNLINLGGVPQGATDLT